jgi:hypothetical protein
MGMKKMPSTSETTGPVLLPKKNPYFLREKNLEDALRRCGY